MRFALLILPGLVVCSVARADVQTIKLTCELNVIVYHPYSKPSSSHETTDVEMQFDDTTGFKAISISSLTVPVNVANSKGGAITSYVDNSDANRWDISSDRERKGSSSQQSAAIDRNTGRLTAYVITTVGNVSERAEARGTCIKVDTTKRKF